jgi:hypothetical protein
MQTTKRYTNQTYTKRVDHEAGKHHGEAAMPEPAVCEVCGNVYADRRWTRPAAVPVVTAAEKHPDFRPPHMVVCPACEIQKSGLAAGYLHLNGQFLEEHLDEIERLLHNEADRAIEDNPLGRIMDIGRAAEGGLTVRTTTEHLAQRLGHALEKAYDGDVRYDFSHENKLAHVWWKRD